MSIAKGEQSVIYLWTTEIMDNFGVFVTHFIFVVVLGVLCSVFGSIPEIFMFIMGIFLPTQFSIQIYNIYTILITNFPDIMAKIPSYPKSIRLRYVMAFDLICCITLSVLIILDILNFFIFRVLAMFFIPFLLLMTLRVLYKANEALKKGDVNFFDV